MAVTQIKYTADGTTTKYSITFEYLRESDVKVSLDGVTTTAFTLANATTVNLNSAPANGVVVRVFRSTDNEELESRFFAGSAIRASDLNKNFEQTLFSVQEVLNRFIDRTQAIFENIINMGGFRITNMADGTDAQDAVTKSQLDAVATDVSTAVADTEAARDVAQQFATNAEDSQFTYNSADYFSALHYSAKASASQTAANTSAGQASTSASAADASATEAQGYAADAAGAIRETLFLGFSVNSTGNLICTYSEDNDNVTYSTEDFYYKGEYQYYITNKNFLGKTTGSPNGLLKPVFNLNANGHLVAPIETN
jgi:hypothetical protein